MNDLPPLASAKIAQLERQGFQQVGVVMSDSCGMRATVDRFGRVQWFRVDESGRMVQTGNGW